MLFRVHGFVQDPSVRQFDTLLRIFDPSAEIPFRVSCFGYVVLGSGFRGLGSWFTPEGTRWIEGELLRVHFVTRVSKVGVLSRQVFKGSYWATAPYTSGP